MVDAIHDHVRRVPRAAVGEHVHVGEDLERADDPGEQHEQRDRPEQRQRDPAEPLPRARPIDPGGIEIRLRDALQTRQEHGHLVTELHPHRHDHYGDERRAGAPQPIQRPQPHRRQEVVDHAEVGLVQPLPDERDGHHRADVGEEAHRPRQTHRPRLPVQRQSRAERQDH